MSALEDYLTYAFGGSFRPNLPAAMVDGAAANIDTYAASLLDIPQQLLTPAALFLEANQTQSGQAVHANAQQLAQNVQQMHDSLTQAAAQLHQNASDITFSNYKIDTMIAINAGLLIYTLGTAAFARFLTKVIEWLLDELADLAANVAMDTLAEALENLMQIAGRIGARLAPAEGAAGAAEAAEAAGAKAFGKQIAKAAGFNMAFSAVSDLAPMILSGRLDEKDFKQLAFDMLVGAVAAPGAVGLGALIGRLVPQGPLGKVMAEIGGALGGAAEFPLVSQALTNLNWNPSENASSWTDANAWMKAEEQGFVPGLMMMGVPGLGKMALEPIGHGIDKALDPAIKSIDNNITAPPVTHLPSILSDGRPTADGAGNGAVDTQAVGAPAAQPQGMSEAVQGVVDGQQRIAPIPAMPHDAPRVPVPTDRFAGIDSAYRRQTSDAVGVTGPEPSAPSADAPRQEAVPAQPSAPAADGGAVARPVETAPPRAVGGDGATARPQESTQPSALRPGAVGSDGIVRATPDGGTADAGVTPTGEPTHVPQDNVPAQTGDQSQPVALHVGDGGTGPTESPSAESANALPQSTTTIEPGDTTQAPHVGGDGVAHETPARGVTPVDGGEQDLAGHPGDLTQIGSDGATALPHESGHDSALGTGTVRADGTVQQTPEVHHRQDSGVEAASTGFAEGAERASEPAVSGADAAATSRPEPTHSDVTAVESRSEGERPAAERAPADVPSDGHDDPPPPGELASPTATHTGTDVRPEELRPEEQQASFITDKVAAEAEAHRVQDELNRQAREEVAAWQKDVPERPPVHGPGREPRDPNEAEHPDEAGRVRNRVDAEREAHAVREEMNLRARAIAEGLPEAEVARLRELQQRGEPMSRVDHATALEAAHAEAELRANGEPLTRITDRDEAHDYARQHARDDARAEMPTDAQLAEEQSANQTREHNAVDAAEAAQAEAEWRQLALNFKEADKGFDDLVRSWAAKAPASHGRIDDPHAEYERVRAAETRVHDSGFVFERATWRNDSLRDTAEQDRRSVEMAQKTTRQLREMMHSDSLDERKAAAHESWRRAKYEDSGKRTADHLGVPRREWLKQVRDWEAQRDAADLEGREIPEPPEGSYYAKARQAQREYDEQVAAAKADGKEPPTFDEFFNRKRAEFEAVRDRAKGDVRSATDEVRRTEQDVRDNLADSDAARELEDARNGDSLRRIRAAERKYEKALREAAEASPEVRTAREHLADATAELRRVNNDVDYTRPTDVFALRHTQWEGVRAYLERKIINQAPAEGKSEVGVISAALVAMDRRAVKMWTSSEALTHKEYELGKAVLEPLGIRVVKLDADTKIEATEQETVAYTNPRTEGFGGLRDNRFETPASLVDEADAIVLDAAGTAFTLGDGGSELASRAVRRAVLWSNRVVRERHLTEEDGHLKVETGFDGNRHVKLTAEGIKKIEELTGRTPNDEGIERLQAAAEVHLDVFKENRDWFGYDGDNEKFRGNVYLIDKSTGEPLLDLDTAMSTQARLRTQAAAAMLTEREAVSAAAEGREPEIRWHIPADMKTNKQVMMRELIASGDNSVNDHVSGTSGTTLDGRGGFATYGNLDSNVHDIDRYAASRLSREPDALFTESPEVFDFAAIDSVTRSLERQPSLNVAMQDNGHVAEVDRRVAERLVELHEAATAADPEAFNAVARQYHPDADSEQLAEMREYAGRMDPDVLNQHLDAARIVDFGSTAERERGVKAIFDTAGKSDEGMGVIRTGGQSAGRGIDIKPDDTAFAHGGLHVHLIERSPWSRRNDQQAENRAARGGEAGTEQASLSINGSELFRSIRENLQSENPQDKQQAEADMQTLLDYQAKYWELRDNPHDDIRLHSEFERYNNLIGRLQDEADRRSILQLQMQKGARVTHTALDGSRGATRDGHPISKAVTQAIASVAAQAAAAPVTPAADLSAAATALSQSGATPPVTSDGSGATATQEPAGTQNNGTRPSAPVHAEITGEAPAAAPTTTTRHDGTQQPLAGVQTPDLQQQITDAGLQADRTQPNAHWQATGAPRTVLQPAVDGNGAGVATDHANTLNNLHARIAELQQSAAPVTDTLVNETVNAANRATEQAVQALQAGAPVDHVVNALATAQHEAAKARDLLTTSVNVEADAAAHEAAADLDAQLEALGANAQAIAAAVVAATHIAPAHSAIDDEVASDGMGTVDASTAEHTEVTQDDAPAVVADEDASAQEDPSEVVEPVLLAASDSSEATDASSDSASTQPTTQQPVRTEGAGRRAAPTAVARSRATVESVIQQLKAASAAVRPALTLTQRSRLDEALAAAQYAAGSGRPLVIDTIEAAIRDAFTAAAALARTAASGETAAQHEARGAIVDDLNAVAVGLANLGRDLRGGDAGPVPQPLQVDQNAMPVLADAIHRFNQRADLPMRLTDEERPLVQAAKEAVADRHSAATGAQLASAVSSVVSAAVALGQPAAGAASTTATNNRRQLANQLYAIAAVLSVAVHRATAPESTAVENDAQPPIAPAATAPRADEVVAALEQGEQDRAVELARARGRERAAELARAEEDRGRAVPSLSTVADPALRLVFSNLRQLSIDMGDIDSIERIGENVLEIATNGQRFRVAVVRRGAAAGDDLVNVRHDGAEADVPMFTVAITDDPDWVNPHDIFPAAQADALAPLLLADQLEPLLARGISEAAGKVRVVAGVQRFIDQAWAGVDGTDARVPNGVRGEVAAALDAVAQALPTAYDSPAALQRAREVFRRATEVLLRTPGITAAASQGIANLQDELADAIATLTAADAAATSSPSNQFKASVRERAAVDELLVRQRLWAEQQAFTRLAAQRRGDSGEHANEKETEQAYIRATGLEAVQTTQLRRYGLSANGATSRAAVILGDHPFGTQLSRDLLSARDHLPAPRGTQASDNAREYAARLLHDIASRVGPEVAQAVADDVHDWLAQRQREREARVNAHRERTSRNMRALSIAEEAVAAARNQLRTLRAELQSLEEAAVLAEQRGDDASALRQAAAELRLQIADFANAQHQAVRFARDARETAFATHFAVPSTSDAEAALAGYGWHSYNPNAEDNSSDLHMLPGPNWLRKVIQAIIDRGDAFTALRLADTLSKITRELAGFEGLCVMIAAAVTAARSGVAEAPGEHTFDEYVLDATGAMRPINHGHLTQFLSSRFRVPFDTLLEHDERGHDQGAVNAVLYGPTPSHDSVEERLRAAGPGATALLNYGWAGQDVGHVGLATFDGNQVTWIANETVAGNLLTSDHRMKSYLRVAIVPPGGGAHAGSRYSAAGD